jgi:hypothetical protein
LKKPWFPFAILIVFLIAVSTLTAGAQSVVRVIVDGRAVGLNPSAVILGARVIVPLRGTFEAMGATVSYLAPRTILVARGSRVIELEIGRPVARVNDSQVLLDTPPITLAGYTRIPLRFVSEALGAAVYFNRMARTVEIFTAPEGNEAFPAPQPQPVPQPIPQPPFPQPVPAPPLPPVDVQLAPPAPARPSRPTVVFPLPGTSVGNPVGVQGTAAGASRVRVTVSVPVVGVLIGSSEATVLPFVGLFSANVSYPGLFRGLPLSITVVAIDSTGTESEPFTVLVRQG